MKWVVFDLETDGLLEYVPHLDNKIVSKIHCACFEDHTGHSWSQVADEHGGCLDLIPENLDSYDYILGHNVQGYDIPVLQKFLPGWVPKAKVLDTQILSRMSWPEKELRARDKALYKAQGEAYMPAPKSPTAKYPPLAGSYSLKAWGYRLGLLKGDFGETSDWSEYTIEMLEYCHQDVSVTVKLWEAIQARGHTMESMLIEGHLQDIFDRQKKRGVTLDVERTRSLYSDLAQRRSDLTQELHGMHPGWTEEYETPVRKEKKTRFIPFNPNSNQQIARLLKERYDWQPPEYTPSGQAKLDEKVFESIKEYPEAELLLRAAQLKKAIGTLGDGSHSYLNSVKDDGRIHGTVFATGTATGRTAHRNPDLNVPKKGKPFASEFRELFVASPDLTLVGADASGLELRCLAHYLARFDGGRYTRQLLEGDIHTDNQKAAGLETRDLSKKFIYAFLYGGGDGLIGDIVGGDSKAGRELKRRFTTKTRGLGQLLEGVKAKAKEQKWLRSILGRRMDIRAVHSALNMLLQGCGADVMKVATTLMDDKIKGLDVWQVLHKHDEYQFECAPELAEQVGEWAVESIREAGDYLKMRCPLDGEYKIGSSWAVTH